jgi:hypothetical protein
VLPYVSLNTIIIEEANGLCCPKVRFLASCTYPAAIRIQICIVAAKQNFYSRIPPSVVHQICLKYMSVVWPGYWHHTSHQHMSMPPRSRILPEAPIPCNQCRNEMKVPPSLCQSPHRHPSQHQHEALYPVEPHSEIKSRTKLWQEQLQGQG